MRVYLKTSVTIFSSKIQKIPTLQAPNSVKNLGEKSPNKGSPNDKSSKLKIELRVVLAACRSP